LDELITLIEAAAKSGLSTSHLALLCRTKKLKAVKKGRDWLTTREAVAAYLVDDEKRSKRPFKQQKT
jgi:hypothetical protein